MNPEKPGIQMRGCFVWMFCLILGIPSLSAQPPVGTERTVDLTLKDFLQRVVERNETLQTHMLEVEISRRKYKAERGIFEPEFFASYERNRTLRENTAEQSGALFNQSTFSELNNVYNSGLESLVPSGARIRVGYTLRDC